MNRRLSSYVSQEQGRVPVTVIHPVGDLNSASYEAFQAKVRQVVKDGARRVLFDLSEVA